MLFAASSASNPPCDCRYQPPFFSPPVSPFPFAARDRATVDAPTIVLCVHNVLIPRSAVPGIIVIDDTFLLDSLVRGISPRALLFTMEQALSSDNGRLLMYVRNTNEFVHRET